MKSSKYAALLDSTASDEETTTITSAHQSKEAFIIRSQKGQKIKTVITLVYHFFMIIRGNIKMQLQSIPVQMTVIEDRRLTQEIF